MKKTLGIVNLHHTVSLGGLTQKRSVASVPLLGRYSFIDFVISNYTNSGINDIIILVKEQMRSLLHHLGFGQLNYTINLKTGGLNILVNEQQISNPIYNTDINNMLENYRYLADCDAENIIIAPVHMLTAIDFAPFIRQHEESGRDISIICQDAINAQTEFLNSFFVTTKDERVSEIKINKGVSKKNLIFLEMTIISKKKLLELLSIAPNISKLYTFRDVLISQLEKENIGCLRYSGYAKCFDSLDHYAEFSLELLKPEIRSELFNKPIFTRTYDTPPARYKENADVSNSFIANGAIINGSVHNSIIGRGVNIGKGAIIRDSIILANSQIAEGAEINKVVIDKNVKVKVTKNIKGGQHYIVIAQGETV